MAEAGRAGKVRVGLIPSPEAYIELAHRESLMWGAHAGRPLVGHACGDGGEGHEREQVEPVVLEDRRKWREVSGTQVKDCDPAFLSPAAPGS